MNEHGHPNRIDDIVEQIDELTKDAASWSTTSEHTRVQWNQAADAMTAVELNMTDGALIAMSVTDPVTAIADRIGAPDVDRISHLRKVALWVGKNSVAQLPVNIGATRFLHHLLADVRDGNYLASDAEREHARALLAAGDLPEIHGPCLVTGLDDDGDTPAPLGENFQSWFTGVLDQVAQLHASLIDAIARELGIPPEHLAAIAVVSAGPLD